MLCVVWLLFSLQYRHWVFLITEKAPFPQHSKWFSSALLSCSNVSFQFPSPAQVIQALMYEAVLTLISGSHQGKLLRVLPNLHFPPLGCWNLLPSR